MMSTTLKLTYEQLFSSPYNCVPAGNFESGTLRWANKTGQVSLSREKFVTPSHALFCQGSSSAQIYGKYPGNSNRYFIAACVSCARYSSGVAGISAYINGTSLYSGVSHTTEGFVPVGICFDNSSSGFTWYCGTMRNTDADAYLDHFVIVNLTAAFGKDIPSDAEILELYRNYIASISTGNVSLSAESVITFSYADCFKAFVRAMKERAASIGMEQTHIISPSGLNTSKASNTSTAKSLNRVNMVANGYPVLNRVWAKKEHKIVILGPNPRTETIVSTVQSDRFEQNYHILGGKTGTYGLPDGTYYYSLLVTAVDKKGRAFCGCVMNATYRWYAMKVLFDRMSRAADDPTYDPYAPGKIVDTECAIGWALPNFNATSAEQYLPPVIYEQNADKVHITASTIKTLSVVTALDHICDVNEWYTICPEDVKGGSGNIFTAGDRVKIIDLIYAMMLPSSNTAATALAHFVGQKILNSR